MQLRRQPVGISTPMSAPMQPAGSLNIWRSSLRGSKIFTKTRLAWRRYRGVLRRKISMLTRLKNLQVQQVFQGIYLLSFTLAFKLEDIFSARNQFLVRQHAHAACERSTYDFCGLEPTHRKPVFRQICLPVSFSLGEVSCGFTQSIGSCHFLCKKRKEIVLTNLSDKKRSGETSWNSPFQCLWRTHLSRPVTVDMWPRVANPGLHLQSTVANQRPL